MASEPERKLISDVRDIGDVQTLRALAHPVRIALLEALSLDGPLTATQAGERIGESATTCSFHLRQLAKYGFVEEAGGGAGRSRPWRMTSIGMRFAGSSEDPELELAAGVLGRMLRERQLDRYRTWLETRSAWPVEWREAAGDQEHVLWMTPDETSQLTSDLAETLLARFRNRLENPAARPDGALPVELLLFSYPVRAASTKG
jgi:predicted ArsR family transcriptional regulator